MNSINIIKEAKKYLLEMPCFTISSTLYEVTKIRPFFKNKEEAQKILHQLKISTVSYIPFVGSFLSTALLKPLDAFNAEKIFTLISKNLNIPVLMGQGEYLIFSQTEKGIINPGIEIYKKAYQILLENTPRKLKKEERETRYTIISEKLKKIDHSLRAVFIPRTLYELAYIEQCIKEDHQFYDEKGKDYLPCSLSLNESMTSELQISLGKKSSKRKKCWHLEKCRDMNNPEINESRRLKKIAYRLNKVMIKEFKPSKEGFLLKQLLTFTEKKVTYLKNHLNSDQKKLDAFGLEAGGYLSYLKNPTSYFGIEESLGLKDDEDAEIIRKAVKLDCSPLAVHSLFIYRGTNHGLIGDSVFVENKYNSLCFGSSLFAGCGQDADATAFYFIKKREGYVLPIPFDRINESPFYIPSIPHPLVEINGFGELFHGRAKAPKDYKLEDLRGVYDPKKVFKENDGTFLLSNRTKEELVEDFEEYKKDAISIKTKKNK